jgi:hypothetical protein
MANGNGTKHRLMFHAITAFVRGCGATEIKDDAADWFHDRYFKWIDTPKSTGKTPQDVWADMGKDFLDKFQEIGRQAAAAGGPVTATTLNTAATTVEKLSECPYCPDKP